MVPTCCRLSTFHTSRVLDLRRTTYLSCGLDSNRPGEGDIQTLSFISFLSFTCSWICRYTSTPTGTTRTKISTLAASGCNRRSRGQIPRTTRNTAARADSTPCSNRPCTLLSGERPEERAYQAARSVLIHSALNTRIRVGTPA